MREFRERLLCDQPPVSFDVVEVSLPSSVATLTDIAVRQSLLDRHHALIQETKTTLAALQLCFLQARLDQCQLRVTDDTARMWEHHREKLPGMHMSTTLTQLIDARVRNLTQKSKVACDLTIRRDIRSPYERMEHDQGRRRRIGFRSALLIDPNVSTQAHTLTHQQLRLLSRGPSYVPPYQLHLLPAFVSSVDDRIKKQYAPLQHHMALLFSRHHIHLVRQETIKHEVKQAFKEHFSRTVPSDVLQRATYEKTAIESIRRTLAKQGLLVRRTADHRNRFYLGHRKAFDEHCAAYMQQADHYTVLFNVNTDHHGQVRQEIERRIQSMNNDLETLFTQKRLTEDVYRKVQVKKETVQLPYLYFLPEVGTLRESGVSVKPMISAQYGATARLARFVHQLLGPVIDRAMNRTAVRSDAHAIQRLNTWCHDEHRLHPTTLFATVTITNFHTMVSHSSMIDTLTHFLTDHLATNQLQYRSITTPKPQHITIATIVKLTQLFFEHSIFYYDGHVYGCTRGAPHGVPLTDALSNIYAFVWERGLLEEPRLKTEFYVRCKDRILFTWNGSETDLRQCLQSLGERNRHVHVETSIGRTVAFLNVHLENRLGHLYTRVHHPADQRHCAMPYVVGDARSDHSRWLRASLLRAGSCCSNVDDFHRERIQLEITALFHGYSVDFVDKHVRDFFHHFNVDSIPYSIQQKAYDPLRRRLVECLVNQRRHADTYQLYETSGRVLHLHYLHDDRSSAPFDDKFHQIWSTYLKDDFHLSMDQTKVVLRGKHVYSSNALLAQQKPACDLLNLSSP